ncbi:MAG TPA: RAMP superfamily CRISPR-associated protein [Candidatus Acidoferrales bacterium]|nr:RAMP superfamily CRISPR-associated protein [Candidatus Acidoferrales bacterium]
MKKLEYELRFLAPAFLGNAEQSAQWRTPPIKALLRQWWRVVWAAEHGFSTNVAAMRQEEGALFGVASDGEGDSRKSRVRLRLDSWAEGKLRSWAGLEQGTVYHPEVQRTNFKVGPHAYLGYGPLDGRGGTRLGEKINATIQAGESATFALAVSDADAPALEKALALMHRFGTLGGRSRNGWGSFALTPQGDTGPLNVNPPLRPWRDCLDRDWPHAVGRDEKGALIWQTAPHADWKALMETLAVIKIGLRTQFEFPKVAPPHPKPLERHWLSYPITRHVTLAFDRNARLPNSLRFKVRALPDGKLVGMIFHVPCLPPPAFRPARSVIEKVWQQVHCLLDELTNPKAGRTYSMIANPQRRAALKPGLDEITLQRVKE